MCEKFKSVESELLAAYSLGYKLIDGRVTPTLSDDLGFINFLKEVSSVCMEIIFKLDSFLVYPGQRKSLCGNTSCLSKLGKKVRWIVMNKKFMPMCKNENIVLAPEVRLFLDCVCEIGFDDENVYDDLFREKLTRLESILRKEAASKKIKNIICNYRRASNKDFDSAVKYIDKLFLLRSRIIVIRIDLSYTKEFASEISNSRHCYKLIKKHREELFKSIPKLLSVKESFLGFIWKLEYGCIKSYHYHCMIFLDGSKIRQSITIAKIIGEKWKCITGDKGLYYNCNSHINKYKYRGVGPINRGSSEEREGLKMAVSYITKPDYYVKAAVPENARIFGKGVVTERMLAAYRKAIKRHGGT